MPGGVTLPKMSDVPEVRLPLQIGTSSLWSLARCSATLLPGLGIVGLGIVALKADVEVGLGIILAGVLLVVFSAMHIRLSIRHRPSDVVLSKDGLRVLGGPHAGERYAWNAIAERASHLHDLEERRLTMFGIVRSIVSRDDAMGMSEVRVLKLQMNLANGESLILAEAERPIEQESLRALHDSLSGGSWRGGAGGKDPRAIAERAQEKQRGLGIRTLHCPTCGAAVAPDDKPSATCRFCATAVPVPEETQERVRAAREVSGAHGVTERLITGLLKQPGADRMNLLLLVFGVPMMLVWPLAFGIGAWRGVLKEIDPVDALWLGLFPLATILGALLPLRAQLVDRQALKLLTLNFGAKEPANAGDPYTCRSCSAPLPEAGGKVVVRCAYCGADNILGLDLRREAVAGTEEAKGLEGAIAQRGRERLLWRGLTGVAGVLLLVGGGVAGGGVGGDGGGAGGGDGDGECGRDCECECDCECDCDCECECGCDCDCDREGDCERGGVGAWGGEAGGIGEAEGGRGEGEVGSGSRSRSRSRSGSGSGVGVGVGVEVGVGVGVGGSGSGSRSGSGSGSGSLTPPPPPPAPTAAASARERTRTPSPLSRPPPARAPPSRSRTSRALPRTPSEASGSRAPSRCAR